MPPAARLTDQTNHAGDTIGPVVTGIAANVIIENLPAACMGDGHLCPLSDGPKPHVGGPITAGSPTVLIGNKLAARINDLTECKGPTGLIATGAGTVIIGDSGGSGGGGGGGGPGGGDGGGGAGGGGGAVSTEMPGAKETEAGGPIADSTVDHATITAKLGDRPDAPPGVSHALLRVQEIDFVGNHPVEKDTQGMFGSPEWRQGRDPADQSPVCYTRNTAIQLTPQFRVVRHPSATDSVEITGEAVVGGSTLRWTGVVAVNPGDARVVAPTMTSSGTLPDHVACFDPLSIHWTARPAGSSVTAAGTSTHLFYVVLGSPTGTPAYWTLLDVSCRAAQGRNTSAAVVSRSYAPFTRRTLSRKRDGQRLTYWNPNTTTATDTRQLLAGGDGSGQCGSWAEFLIDMWKVHGITGADKILIVTSVADLRAGRKGFLVKNWTFLGSGSRPAPFTHVLRTECREDPGIPGQRNPNPPPAFFNHFIVRFGGAFYDPSYGGGPVPEQSAWENGAIDGLFSGDVAGFEKSRHAATNLLEFWDLTTRSRI